MRKRPNDTETALLPASFTYIPKESETAEAQALIAYIPKNAETAKSRASLAYVPEDTHPLCSRYRRPAQAAGQRVRRGTRLIR